MNIITPFMDREIERKFLLKVLPADVGGASILSLEQGYLALEKGGQEVRLRRSGDQCWLTVKTSGELARREFETILGLDQFQKLWPATEGRRLRKDRYLLEYREWTIEVDVYHQPLQGLIVAEVEFPSVTEAAAFEPPSWMGREITHLNFLKNRELLQFQSMDELWKWLDEPLE